MKWPDLVAGLFASTPIPDQWIWQPGGSWPVVRLGRVAGQTCVHLQPTLLHNVKIKYASPVRHLFPTPLTPMPLPKPKPEERVYNGLAASLGDMTDDRGSEGQRLLVDSA